MIPRQYPGREIPLTWEDYPTPDQAGYAHRFGKSLQRQQRWERVQRASRGQAEVVIHKIGAANQRIDLTNTIDV